MRFIRLAAATVVAGALFVSDSAGAAPVQRGTLRSPQFDAAVFATAYLGGTVYVGGDFAHAIVNGHNVARTRLAAFNARTGALLDWAPAADGQVRALAADGHFVYASGDFRKVSGAGGTRWSRSMPRAARWPPSVTG